MVPFTIPGPIPPAIEQDVRKHIQDALQLLIAYKLSLSAEDRQRLGSSGLGPESLPFAEEARLLMAAFPEVLPRSITDDMITGYGQRLDTVTSCHKILADLNAVRELVFNLDVAAGAGLMDTARAAYKAAQQDAGRTPGVADLVRRMAHRFARAPRPDDEGTAPKA